MIKVFRWYLPYWKLHSKGMISIIFLTVFAIAVKTSYPLIFKYVIDALVAQVAIVGIYRWVAIIFAVGVIRELTQWLLPALRYVLNLTQAQDIRLRHFDAVIQKDYRFFYRYRTGDLITRLTDDIDGELKLSWYSCSGVMRPIEAGLTLFFSIAMMMTLSWELTIYAILPLPIIIWTIAKTEHVQSRAYKKRQQMTSQTTDVLESAFSGIRIVIGYVTEKSQSKIFQDVMKERVEAEEEEKADSKTSVVLLVICWRFL